jgi:hypothetical protein
MKDMFSEAIPQNINWMSIEGGERHELLLLVQMVNSVVGIWSLLSKNPSQPATNGSGPREKILVAMFSECRPYWEDGVRHRN